MIARVVTKRDDARAAVAVTAFAAVALALVLADDLLHWRHVLPLPFPALFATVAALMVLGAIGPWLARAHRRGRKVSVRCDERGVWVGSVFVAAAEVDALSVARAAHGHGVAIGRGRDVMFLEVERADEARQIATALGVSEPPCGAVEVRRRSWAVAGPQALLSLVGMLFAVGYLLAAMHVATLPALGDAKAFFGIGGVAAAQLSLVLLLVRRLLPGHVLAPAREKSTGRARANTRGRSVWDAHVALHAHAADATAAATAAAAAATATATATDARGEPEVAQGPVQSLARGDERVATWLARIDALPAEGHVYRGDAMKKDVLWQTLGDEGAPVEARMAAARLLRRRHGHERDALVRVVLDDDVRVRVEAAMDPPEEAERHIETLGPLFRARRARESD